MLRVILYCVLGSFLIVDMDKKLPRGLRNNNPLNIRIGSHWLGEVEDPTDKEFEQFSCIHYGLRAAFYLLRRYIERYGLKTIPEIVSRWAPASENNTKGYIDIVVQLSGIQKTENLKFSDREKMVALVDAMAVVECGQHVERMDIVVGYEMARLY